MKKATRSSHTRLKKNKIGLLPIIALLMFLFLGVFATRLAVYSKTAQDLAPKAAIAPQQSSSGLLTARAQDLKVFVSSETHTGNFGDIYQADTFCQDLANDAGYSGFYRAWLSDSTHNTYSNRFSSGRYLLVDGTVVADNKTDLLDGTLDHAINLDEYGATWNGAVFTGTQANGLATNDHCDNWSAPGADWASSGVSSFTSSGWTNASWSDCRNPGRVYCFQTVPQCDVNAYGSDIIGDSHTAIFYLDNDSQYNYFLDFAYYRCGYNHNLDPWQLNWEDTIVDIDTEAGSCGLMYQDYDLDDQLLLPAFSEKFIKVTHTGEIQTFHETLFLSTQYGGQCAIDINYQ